MSGESRALVLRLALRAIRWRAAGSATVFVVAIVAVLAATMGPIYLRAVDETVLAAHLKHATLFQRDVLVSRNSVPGYPGVDWDAQLRSLTRELARDHSFARPVFEEQLGVTFGGTPPSFKGEIAAIEGVCVHVRIIRGRCPSGNSSGETLISTTTAASQHLTVGSTLAATATNGVAIRLRVVGVYRPLAPRGSFWQPWDLFQFGQPTSGEGPAPADASFVSSAALSSRLQRVPQTLSANVPLLAGGVHYGDTGRLRSAVARLNSAVAHLAYRAAATGAPAPSVTTSIPAILDATATETSLAERLVTLATAQLALLAMFVLYAAVANTTVAQAPEVALAKLRGRRAGSVLLQSVAQPVALVLVAAPLAALLAWLVVRLSAARLLGHPVNVVFPPAAFGVAALAVLGGVLAALVAGYRIVVTPVGALMRLGAAPRGSPIGLVVADATAVTLAVAGLIELKASGVLDSGQSNPLSLVAPTLLGVAAGIVALRLVPILARPLARWTRDSRRLATFLAVRQVQRRPADARAILLVAVAVAIATFAISTWATARHNRSLRALNTAGAHTVLVVRPGAGVPDLRTAVDRADPRGHSMAVAYTSVDQLPPLIAIDTAHFASVGAWVSSNSRASLSSVLHRLAGELPPPITVSGTRLRLRVDLIRRPPQPVRLAVRLAEPNHNQAVRAVPGITAGTKSYDISLPLACASGCRLGGLDLTANSPDNFYAPNVQLGRIDAVIGASIRSARGWRPVMSFGDPNRWRGDGKGPVAIGGAGTSLSLDIRQTSGAPTWPSVVSAAIPSALPAAVASDTAALYKGNQIHGLVAVGLDGQTVSVDGVIRSVALPQLDRNGVMVDFATALSAMGGTGATTTRYQVWLSPAAPSDMAARLARQHVYVERTIHSFTYGSALDHSGPAYADSLFILAALVAIVLAIGATAVARVTSSRRRGYELAALEAIGVSPSTLRRAMALEQGSVFGIGLLVGLAAGLAGSWLALPSTPVFVHTSIGPPLVLGLPWVLLATLAIGLVIVFVGVSIAIAGLVERAATPSLLRGAQQ